MKILITNDDGIHARGLLALAQAAAHFGQVLIVAPDRERSAAGHAISIGRRLTCNTASLDGFEAYAVDGAPADCVMVGLRRFGRFDLALSGINPGANLGDNMWHSGTLSAARQAVIQGLPGLAFSLDASAEDADYAAIQPALVQALEALIDRCLPGQPAAVHPPLINVNFPAHLPRGLAWTFLSRQTYNHRLVEDGGSFSYITVPFPPADEGSDRWAIENGWVSLTPMRLDLTDRAVLDGQMPGGVLA